MTRTIAQYIAQGYMVEKGKPNPALDAAGKLTIDSVEAALLGVSLDGVQAENKPGSFERLMGVMGQGGVAAWQQ